MSAPAALDRLYRLGAAARQAVESWRQPLGVVDRLQGGLERYGFDATDPLAGLLQGFGAGVGLSGVLERLAQPAPEVAFEPEAAPLRHAPVAQAFGGSRPAEVVLPRADRYATASVREPAPHTGKGRPATAAQTFRRFLEAQPGTVPPTVGSSPRPASAPAPAQVQFSIGPQEAQARLARRAAAAGAAIAWDGQAVASGRQGPTSKAATGGPDAAPSSGERKAPEPVAFLAEGADAAESGADRPWSSASGLEQILERIEAARGTGSGQRRSRASAWSRTPSGAEEALTQSPLGSPNASSLAAAISRPASGGEGSVFPGPAQSGLSWEPGSAIGPRGRIGGLRGLALLGQHGAVGGRLAQTSSQGPAAPSGVTGASQALTIATSRPEGDFAESATPMGIGQAAAAAALDGEVLARELARLLRREAERHGIDLDGVGP